MNPSVRFGDLMRALAVSRSTLRQQIGIGGGGLAAGWRVWTRADVAVFALQRAVITAGVGAEAARAIAAGVVPAGAQDAADVPRSWLVIMALPDRWVWGLVRNLGLRGESPPQWPYVVIHPRAVVAAAYARLDSDDAPEVLPAVPPNVRVAERMGASA